MSEDVTKVTRLSSVGRAKPATFGAKLLALYERFSYVQKTGKNDHFKYRFMEESELKRRLNEACRELGLIIGAVAVEPIGEITPKAATVRVTLTIADEAGESGVTWQGIGSGVDSSDKAAVKAMVAAVKYAIATGCAVQTGNDPEADASVDEDAEADLMFRIKAATDTNGLELLKAEIVGFRGSESFEALKQAFAARKAALLG